MRGLKLSLLIGSTTLLMIGFQNCAKYQYAQVDKLANGSNAGLNTDNLPDGTILPIDQTNASNNQLGAPVDEQMPGAEKNPPSSVGGVTQPPVIVDNTPHPTEGGDMPKPPVLTGGDDTPKPPVLTGGDDTPKSHEGGGNPTPIDDLDECQLAKLKSSSNIDSFADAHNGKMIITAENQGNLREITDFHGKIILCGVHMTKVCSTGGNLTLINSTVDEICDHNGGIKLLGDSSCKDINGSKALVEIDRNKGLNEPVNVSQNGNGKGHGKN